MSRLVWNAPGNNEFYTGLDRGVLYSSHQRGRAWNGLVNVSESLGGGENEPIYYDGMKVNNRILPEEYEATIEAYTYPNQFESGNLGVSIINGMRITGQSRRAFGLSYRTGMGTDTVKHGENYRIHLVYNAKVVDKDQTHSTIQDGVSPDLFSWGITTTPVKLPGYRPTSHFIIDSRYTNRLLLERVEDILYGRPGQNAWWIDVETLIELFRSYEPTGYGYGLYGRTSYGHGYEFMT